LVFADSADGAGLIKTVTDDAAGGIDLLLETAGGGVGVADVLGGQGVEVLEGADEAALAVVLEGGGGGEGDVAGSVAGGGDAFEQTGAVGAAAVFTDAIVEGYGRARGREKRAALR
jgi:hypothetical protein